MLNEIDLSRIDLNLLVLFDVVLRERHVGRAAERLSLSPSAVSHGLGRLRRLLNDPVFLRTPKGVVPTERATDLAAPIADILAQVLAVLSRAEPFVPKTSTRRFTIGAPDGVSAALLPALLAALKREGAMIDISVRQVLPEGGARLANAWQPALDALEARSMDIAIVPIDGVPARFAEHVLYQEEFVVAAHSRHPFLKSPSLKRFCEMKHLLVSMTGDAHGFVDMALAQRGLQRRIALTVPNFMMALAIISQSDLIATLPRKLVTVHAKQFGIAAVASPLPVRRDNLRIVTSNAALMDNGVAWLFTVLRGLRIKLCCSM